MKQIIQENYQATVKRGLINDKTSSMDFILKLKEEVQEFIDAEYHGQGNRNEELADVILVCLAFAKHHDIDIESELKKKIEINESRI